MDTNTIDQILHLVEKSQRILLLTHARADADGLGAMISTYLILKDLGKTVTAVTNDPAPDNLGFLPAIDIVQNSLASSHDFIITLDCSQTPLNKIKYNLEGNRVNIIVSPKNGDFSEKDVSFSQGIEQYDLIMTFDTGNLEHLGPIYEQNTEMFFKTPLVNIDHHSSNTDFGQVNLVDLVASSTTEVLYGLLLQMEKQADKKLITEDIATLLLAGIITDTGSFQHANTSPRSMEVAAKLLDLGARQQEIIKNIYKTKKLSTLKLWGIVLSKVQVDPTYRMVWSTISQEDLRDSGADSEETGSIIDDLLCNTPGAEVIFLIKHNTDGVISVSMRSTSNQVDVGSLCAEMGGGGHVRAAGFKVRDGRSFEQVMSEVITKVHDFQKERLNIHEAETEMSEMESEKPQSTPTMDETVYELPEKKTEEVILADHSEPSGSKQETYLDFDTPTTAPKPKKELPALKKEKKKAVTKEVEVTEKVKPKRKRRHKKSSPKQVDIAETSNSQIPEIASITPAEANEREKPNEIKKSMVAEPTMPGSPDFTPMIETSQPMEAVPSPATPTPTTEIPQPMENVASPSIPNPAPEMTMSNPTETVYAPQWQTTPPVISTSPMVTEETPVMPPTTSQPDATQFYSAPVAAVTETPVMAPQPVIQPQVTVPYSAPVVATPPVAVPQTPVVMPEAIQNTPPVMNSPVPPMDFIPSVAVPEAQPAVVPTPPVMPEAQIPVVTTNPVVETVVPPVNATPEAPATAPLPTQANPPMTPPISPSEPLPDVPDWLKAE
ncbi:hypothetical protein COY07_06530 [Candidatus Peregrinibacteria bacterium CG_4_10_14_0_2_um_filter_43_11]|nr:MAG: hypothetical protein COY07_06530 [Candidatus Peregrinibacteria bacterium CG_4_10_14_0_2_um_filter_43_11]